METEPGESNLLWETERLIAQRLGPGHAGLLQRVFVAAGDYFLRVGGRPEPDADAAERELEACASAESREVAVLIDAGSGEPIGAIGWWCRNPDPEVALLGMLMIVPARRGEGLAREALHGLEGWLVEQEMNRLRTAVSARNYPEHKLLIALGFSRMSIRDHTLLGLGGSHLALFEKPIP